MNRMLKRVVEGSTYAGLTDLTVVTCPMCGIVYAIPEGLRATAQERGNHEVLWMCPNGHELGYADSPTARLREDVKREAERAARLQARLDQAHASLQAQKAAAKRARNERDRERARSHAGVCPAGCRRHFVNLERHMASKHPGFGDGRAA